MKRSDPTDRRLMNTKLNGFYRGICEDNQDPELRGRVRARIWGIHTSEKTKTPTEGVPTEELPWVEPCLPIMEGGISGFGMFGVPVQGSHIMIFFENSSILQPRYFATLPGVPAEAADSNEGFNDPAGTYPTEHRLGQPDWHRLARGITGDTAVTTKNNMRDSIEPRSPAAPEYPHNFVIATHGGIMIELDSTPGAERLHLYHPSNSYIEIDKSGNMVIRSNQDKFEVVIGRSEKHITGDETSKIDGNLDIQITGNATITATGSCDVKGNPINLN